MEVLGIILGILSVILGLVVICLILYRIYYLIETVGQAKTEVVGKVLELDFVPAHVDHVYNVALKITMPRSIPDKWSINVTVDDGELDGMECSKELYESVKKGTVVLVSYKLGRLSGNKYLVGVEKI